MSTAEKWWETEIGSEITQQKYLYDGEDFFDFVDRVAGIFSTPGMQERIKNALVLADFFPAGRSLYGAGSKGKFKCSMSNCFTSGHKVITNRGLINIEDVVTGDKVITDNGSWQTVNEVMHREYTGDLYEIVPETAYDKITCTPNHRFLTEEGWVRADRLLHSNHSRVKACSKLKVPTVSFNKVYNNVDLLSETKNDYMFEIYEEDGKLGYKVKMMSASSNEYWCKQGNLINRFLVLDNDFMYFIGRWIGDGSVTSRKQGKRRPSVLQIVFNATTERDAFERCKSIGEQKFGIVPSVRETEQNTIALRFENPIISTWFFNEFGKGCEGKCIPDKYTGDFNIALGLLDSDGSIHTHGAVSITLKNKGLIDWLRDTLYLNGINCKEPLPTKHENTFAMRIPTGLAKARLNVHLTKTYRDKREGTVNLTGIERDYVKVMDVEVKENITATVYNLSVEGTHSYSVNGVICHNCYILPSPIDTLESINKVCGIEARISSYGGGCGVNISNLRPRDSVVRNSARTSTGAVSFIKIFDAWADVVGSNHRRAALMIGINCDHPDVEEFIDVKMTVKGIDSANTSILFTDEFMKAVREDTDFELKFDVKATGEEIRKIVKAKDLFMKVSESNWDWGNPGCLFIDTVRNSNLLSCYPDEMYHIDISNPCSEYSGNAFNACNLGSINLYHCVSNPFTDKATIDFGKLSRLVELGVAALDEILDYGMDMQPFEENRQCIRDWRAIGLGVFGLADMFVALGVQYGDDDSIEITKIVMKTIFDNAVITSSMLAKEKGTFGMYDWNYIKDSPLIESLPAHIYGLVKHYGLRNGSLVSIAPTGSIATMSNMSGGVEPYFGVKYKRTTHALEKEGIFFTVFAQGVKDLLAHEGLSESMTEEEIKKRFPYIISSNDIEPFKRIAVQAAMQKYVDNSISSTINLNKSATIEDVFNIYVRAWEEGCKGITVFRNGCKKYSVMVNKATNEEKVSGVVFDSVTPIKIGNSDCKKIVKHTACVEELNIFVGNENGNIVEVFTGVTQGCTANIGAITVGASHQLRLGEKVSKIISGLRKIKCQACIKCRDNGDKTVSLSCGNAIADAIEEEYVRIHGEQEIDEDTEFLPCPKCGKNTLRPVGNCATCSNCSYNSCEGDFK